MGHEHVQVKSVIKTCRKQERVTFCNRGSHNAAAASCLRRMITEKFKKEPV
jgi:hypothetical protein